MPARRSEILRLLDQLEGPIWAAFRDAVANIRSQARIDRLAAALAAGNVEAAFAAVGYRPGSWTDVHEKVRNAYVEGGLFTIAKDVPARFGMQFDITNPRAEAWLRQHSSQFVTLISADQRDAIQIALRAGMEAGRNPRNTALDIVGRISKQTGRRAGGIVGLNAPQAEAVMRARAELEALDANYFSRVRRDRRFDSLVRRAIADGKPLDQATINRLVGRYSDRLLALRGEMVARTESLTALNSAASEAMNQVVDQGLAPRDSITRIWDATMDSRTRPAHASMNGQKRGLDQPFQSGTGALLMHPGDTSMGAGAADVVACRCVITTRIDFVAVEQAA